eukprot:Phypoly_transcript_05293.p1 GENE.Phypoly_transcript_05293~~Phypoly_transcript_05293.p1  ORF type:complete len:518 (+),score=79.43 Phypoly_transcript_05293:123-1676(+)
MKLYIFVLCFLLARTCSGESMQANVVWKGGTDDCQCEGSDSSYACTTGDGSGNWANGVQTYKDLQTDPTFILTQVTVSIYGSFDCFAAQVINILLNDQPLGSVETPLNDDPDCAICRNCWATLAPITFSSHPYTHGIPFYNQNNQNTVAVTFPYPITSNETHFCISHIALTLTYNETTEVSDSSSSDHFEIAAPPWFWTLIATAGVIVVVIVLTLFILWRRSSSQAGSGGVGPKGAWGGYRPLSTTEYVDTRQLEDISMDFKEFTVEGEIGHGSFGLVHKAMWRGTEVAIKRLPRESITEQQVLLEFMKEAFIMRQLRHPNVLQVLGVCIDPPCIIMEYMPRGSLFQLIHNPNIPMDWPTVRKLAIEICRGMAYLHGCNPPLIHRDLKPHNLLVDDMWRVKVCDFGLSRFWEAKKDMTACGTPAYAAPEVLRNSAYSVSADVYSFAMVLWELITRQPLYPGIPPFQIIFTVGTQGMRPTIPPTCNPGLASVIQECWAEDPSNRPSFVALADRIAQMP